MLACVAVRSEGEGRWRRAPILPLLLTALWTPQLQAQPGKDKDPLSFDRSIRGLLQRYCYRCHNADEASGDINLAADENPALIVRNRSTWLTAAEMIQSGQMPPDDARQPDDDERELILQFLEQTVSDVDCQQLREPGRPTIRRLNRTEYDNAIRYLTALDLRLAEDFAPDATSYGFDNIGDALSLSPVQVQQYHSAAQRVVTALTDGAAEHAAARRRVYFISPGDGVSDREAARRIIERFARRAFRRDVDSALIQSLLALYDAARSEDESHEAAVGHLLTAVLISPRFLMRIEQARPDADAAYPVDAYDLASRLSFFLWSAPPDDALLELAERGELSNLDALESQTLKMLGDQRSDALIDNFFGQWLRLRELDAHQPDPQQFPEFDEALRQSMRQEVRALLSEVVRGDRPLTDLIDADYTYVDQRLAKHYGLADVQGESLRRVPLTDRRRGGLLTTAAVLMLQSDPTRVNVPRRGNYVAATILGTAPPPPPPDVPPLEQAAAADQQLTLREIFEKHRENRECASCHEKIDPLGFGLHNYDAIGRWRDEEGGKPVDASGVLPDGRAFDGPIELKQILLERRDELVRTMSEQLLVYALGRGLEYYDECVVQDAVKAAQENDYRFSALVLEIVSSYPFRHRKNPEF